MDSPRSNGATPTPPRIEDSKPSSSIVLKDSSAYREQRAEEPVELVLGGNRQRQPAGRGRCPRAGRRRRRRSVAAQVALQQPAIDPLVTLVGVAAHERLHREVVETDVQPHRRRQLAAAGQSEGEDTLAGLLELQLLSVEVAPDGRRPAVIGPTRLAHTGAHTGSGHQRPGLLIDLERGLGGAVPGEAGGVLQRATAQPVGVRRVAQHPLERGGPATRVVPVDQQSTDPVAHRRWSGRRPRLPPPGCRLACASTATSPKDSL